MSVTDEVRAAAQEVAALFRDNYMVPNTWPPVRRFLAAVEALDGPATADGPQSQGNSQGTSQSSGPGTDTPTAGTASPAPAPVDVPADPLPQDKPERQSRAPLS